MAFYVYAFRDDNGDLAYIGKGTGKRFQKQKTHMARKGITQGEIVWQSGSERRAYRMERALIARHRPWLNKQPGGYGGLGYRTQLRRTLSDVVDLRSRMKPFRQWISENPERWKFVHHYRDGRRTLQRIESRIRRELGADHGSA